MGLIKAAIVLGAGGYAFKKIRQSREEKFRGGEGSHRCSCSNHGRSQASPSDEKSFSSPQTEHYGAVPPGVKVQGQPPYNRDEKEDWVGVNEKELGGMRGAAGA